MAIFVAIVWPGAGYGAGESCIRAVVAVPAGAGFMFACWLLEHGGRPRNPFRDRTALGYMGAVSLALALLVPPLWALSDITGAGATEFGAGPMTGLLVGISWQCRRQVRTSHASASSEERGARKR